MSYFLGIGLTNACNLSCDHCYRATGTDSLTMEQVVAAVESIETQAVNFGTGENGLHPEFAALVRWLTGKGIVVTMTTNGHSAAVLEDSVLALFGDVEFSIDYPDRDVHDAARGEGNWDLIAEQMARAEGLGVSATIATVMMATNVRQMGPLLTLAGARSALLRVNVYQAVRRDMFSLSYDDFWQGFRDLLEGGELLACGEPVVRAALGLPRSPGAGCGAQTVRITPRGEVVPCVYGGGRTLTLADLVARGAGVLQDASFRVLDTIPAACADCLQRATCGGGCPSRRSLRGSLEARDPYCPLERGVALSAALTASDRTLAKAASACTTILRPYRPQGWL